MKIVRCEQFGPPETLERVETAIPEPGSGQVRVRITAAGVGFVDGLMIQGLYQVKPNLPYFPGSEFAGTIDALGADVNGFAVGDRVFGMAGGGAFADYTVVAAPAVFKCPANLDDATAAGLFINYATALYGFRDCGKLAAGETVLILGAAGGVGSAGISMARALGARVIAAASSQVKRDAALTYGADATVDYTQSNWRDALRELTPDGLNVVYDPVGGDISEQAFRSLAPGGRFLVVGFAAGEIPAIPLNLPLLKRSAIVGVDWGGEMRAHPDLNQALMGTLLEMIETGVLTPAPVTRHNMADYQAALKDQLAGAITGKLVLVNT